jgi:hypothetical protein
LEDDYAVASAFINKNETGSDNKPKNLDPKRNHFAHKALHRKRDRGLRNPGERNPLIKCKCGCGGKLRKFDGENRPRKILERTQ